jgi:DNA-binding NarL/FixJ family response regulator
LFQQVSQTASSPDPNLAQLLSDRELAVLRLMAHGLPNPEIAQKLYLSEGTVRNYVSSVLTKMGVADRTQAVVLAIRSGLVQIND